MKLICSTPAGALISRYFNCDVGMIACLAGSRLTVGMPDTKGRNAMRYVISISTILGSLAAAAVSVHATEVTRTYTSGSYTYTCIMEGGIEKCGNYNIYTPIK